VTTPQPSGTVTFLFTDVEGSTTLLAQLGNDRYAAASEDHRRLLRAAFARYQGYEIDWEGDGFAVAFQRAAEAVAAAEEAQRALAAHPWPDGRTFLVRMGIHTGEPLLAPPKYVGLDVHLAARITAAAHGGQVLLSKATRDAIDVPNSVVDLGEHRLKDIAGPVSIFQLGDGSFPPLRTISNTNLPRLASSFVGRQRELSEVIARLESARLLTLTGPAGAGKTRLALEVAASLVPDYKAGVFWVGLAALRNPALVTGTISRVLGAQDDLAEHIEEREMLLLLDNFEQVIDAAPELSALVHACPALTLLVTSRELLRVQGEAEYPVPALAESEAVQLFCERARIEPSTDVAGLCARLDNLPLAVELAAARSNVLSPRQILERVSQRLDLLHGGRDADPRQQTLRATMEWSYDLLSEEERRLFRRFSVFAGGCTLEAVEVVCAANIDTLQSLIGKNLLRFSNERYWMLATIRDFALGLADEDTEDIRRAHAHWYLALAERAARELFGSKQAFWLELLEREHDNLRAALTWGHETGNLEQALQLTVALRSFWFMHGHISEGRRWFELALESCGRPLDLRARAFGSACVFAAKQGDLAHARELAAQGLALSRKLGDPRGTAILLRDSGAAAAIAGDHAAAEAFYEEGAELFRELGERPLLASLVANLGDLAFRKGDLELAEERMREGLALQRELGEMYGVAISLHNLGFIALHEGRFEDARETLAESLVLAHDLGYADSLANAFEGLAAVAAARGRWDDAARLVGRAEAIREASAIGLDSAEQAIHEQTLATLGAARSEDEIEEGRSAGRAMTDEAAMAIALELDSAVEARAHR
jgi:predicted ATPase/class 3 adenylate cyclase